MIPSTKDVRPLGAWVLVRPVFADEGVRDSGLVLIGQKTDLLVGFHIHGIVIATGPGTRDRKGRLHPTGVKPGDRVIARSGFGPEIDFQEGPHWFLRADGFLVVTDENVTPPERGERIQEIAPVSKGPDLAAYIPDARGAGEEDLS